MADQQVALPQKISLPNGAIYQAVLIRICDVDENNIPENLVLLPESRPVEINGGDRFMVAYVPQEVMNP